MICLLLICIACLASVTVNAFRPQQVKLAFANLFMAKEELDSQGYIIKPRDWFNGLSADPGASLTDPRAVPPVMKAFAEKIKNGGDVATFAECIQLIDENYDYFAVPFQVGDLKSAANENKVIQTTNKINLCRNLFLEQVIRIFNSSLYLGICQNTKFWTYDGNG